MAIYTHLRLTENPNNEDSVGTALGNVPKASRPVCGFYWRRLMAALTHKWTDLKNVVYENIPHVWICCLTLKCMHSAKKKSWAMMTYILKMFLFSIIVVWWENTATLTNKFRFMIAEAKNILKAHGLSVLEKNTDYIKALPSASY